MTCFALGAKCGALGVQGLPQLSAAAPAVARHRGKPSHSEAGGEFLQSLTPSKWRQDWPVYHGCHLILSNSRSRTRRRSTAPAHTVATESFVRRVAGRRMLSVVIGRGPPAARRRRLG